MSLAEYRNLLFEVSKKIAWITERERLLFICKAFLPDGYESNIQDVLSLFAMLDKENQLGIDKLDVLKDLLQGMGKSNLLQIVEKFENKRREYKSLLEQCGRELDEPSQMERLISVCKEEISRDRQEQITDVWTLFKELEKQNNLGIKRLGILKAMANEMEKPDLLEQIEEFEKKRKQEEDAERSQVQTAAVLAFAGYAGGRLIGTVTALCTFRNVTGGILTVTTAMILRRSSSLEEFVNTFTKTVLPLGNTLLAISEGSLCFTVHAQNTLALEALWKTYQDGTLQRKLQEFLITEEIKELVGCEVKLTVKIDEQEYKNASWDLMATKTQEMEVREERKGFEDQTSSDFAHARVIEAYPQARAEASQKPDINLLDRTALVKEYLANLQETYSMTSETTDSGLGSQSAPFEPQLYKGAEDFQEFLEQVDEWIKEISNKLAILEEPEGEATRDEDQLGNIQQVRIELANLRIMLDKLEKPEGKAKYGEDFQELLEQVDERIKWISERVVILAEPEGEATRDEECSRISAEEVYGDLHEMDNSQEVIMILEQPSSQKIKEGLKVELVFKCKARANSKLTYQWYKDGKMLQGEDTDTLVFKSVRMFDFGWYKCAARCKDTSSLSLESSPAELNVTPRDGRMYKCLKDIDLHTEDRIAILLDEKSYSIGGWRQVAYKYGMDQLKIKYLENYPDAGKKTLEYLHATDPYLTVYDFCKTLKEHERLDIVSELQEHLSVPSS